MHKAVGITAGRRTIVPKNLPVAIAGHAGTAHSVADPLEINAVLFTEMGRRILLATFDLLYIGGSLEGSLRARLREQHGFADEDVLLFASHTHFAPPTDASLPLLGDVDHAYCRIVEDEFLDLVGELVRGVVRPVCIQIRQGLLQHSVNRRRPRLVPVITRHRGIAWDKVTLAPYEDGVRNEMGTVLTLADAETKEATAILWHYTCHPVSHQPSDVVTSEFPGVVRIAIRKHSGRPLPVLFLQGFCGDVRPNHKPERPHHLAERIRDHFLEAMRGVARITVSPELWLRWAMSMGEGVTRILLSDPILCEQPRSLAVAHTDVPIAAFFSGKARRDKMNLRGLRLGSSLEILGFGAEPVAGWQTRLNDLCPSRSKIRLLSGYCGDVFGYLPLPEQVPEGGYEVELFQPHFGFKGRFDKDALVPAIRSAVEKLTASVNDDLATIGCSGPASDAS